MLDLDRVPDSNPRPQGATVPGQNGAHADGDGAGAPQGEAHIPDLVDILADLSAYYVPAFCDSLSLTLSGAGASTLTVHHPAAESGHNGSAAGDHGGEPAQDSSGPGRVVIAVHRDGALGEAPITGSMTCRWHDAQRPSELDAILARLLADHAVASVRIHGLDAALRVAGVRAGNLEQALATNREIGQAIGVLMATDHITAEQAFDRLRTASQHAHRKLRDIATEVAETGVLAAPPGPSTAPGSNGLFSAGRARGGNGHSPLRTRREGAAPPGGPDR